MVIHIKKFGDTLVSRDAGKEALAAFRPTLQRINPDEKIQIDFSGVFTLSPSWASEFISALQKEYADRIELLPTENAAVNMTIEFLNRLKC